ncbi:hypothetical protein ASG89_02735 [Paenibacillus sp. Soil766]|uniref:carboxylesterase family protein n=1 Tax=Paenibacillus sp. Soil766 TaxID=1736404 RepID=UPI0007094DD8|nr:prolyl oligopeptidase family serine peptidase [Paenibacillus sp. Soil766]KRF03693.1 hypothetical protein ASG89_02735 [Paenibacillus sp. Soil766]
MRRVIAKRRFALNREIEANYRVYLPHDYEEEGTQEWPLVVFLHGAGERGDDSARLEMHGPPKEVAAGRSFPFLLVAPQCPEGSVWIMQKDRVLEILHAVQRQYRVDPRRVYLTGISMGGFGTWEIAMEHQQLFAAIMPICGGGMSWRASQLTQMPIWTFHGSRDDVVPIMYTEEMVRAVKAIGNPIRYTVITDAGHDCWTEVYQRKDVYEWLLAQRLPR